MPCHHPLILLNLDWIQPAHKVKPMILPMWNRSKRASKSKKNVARRILTIPDWHLKTSNRSRTEMISEMNRVWKKLGKFEKDLWNSPSHSCGTELYSLRPWMPALQKDATDGSYWSYHILPCFHVKGWLRWFHKLRSLFLIPTAISEAPWGILRLCLAILQRLGTHSFKVRNLLLPIVAPTAHSHLKVACRCM